MAMVALVAMAMAGSPSVICTELFRQGYLAKEIFEADGAYAKKFVSGGVSSIYHFWAKPLVRLMQKSNFITQIVRPYGTAWATHMAYEMGTVQEDNWLGKQLHNTFLPLHQKISSILFSTEEKVVQSKPSVVSAFSTEIVYLVALLIFLGSLILIPIILLLGMVFLFKEFIGGLKEKLGQNNKKLGTAII